jgi:hypothetical protein
MFENIAQMEKEIEEFRKNIIASSELVKRIADLTEATKQHKDSFILSSETLIAKLDDCVAQFKSDHDNSLKALESDNAALIENLQQTIAQDIQEWLSSLEKTKNAIETCEEVAISKNDEKIQRFSSECDRLIDGMHTHLVSQKIAYDESLKALENSNAALIENLQQSIAKDVQEWLASLEKNKTAIETCEKTTISKTDEQIKHFSSECDRLIDGMQSNLVSQKTAYDESLKALEHSNATVIENLQQAIAQDVQEWLTSLDKTKTAIETCEQDTISKTDEQIKQFSSECRRLASGILSVLTKQQSAYLDKLNETEKVINGYQVEAENKYNNFVQRLETTNVDQIFKEVQDLKKTLNTKIAILMTGVGISIVLAIISVFIK